MSKQPKCRVCLAGLRDDGTCPFKCVPVKPKGRRVSFRNGVRDRGTRGQLLTLDEASEGVRRAEPKIKRMRWAWR